LNWDAIGAVGELVGAIAVVATLIYFSSQIRSMQSSEVSNVLDRIVSNELEILKMERESSALIVRGNRGETLTDEERLELWKIVQAHNSLGFHGHRRAVMTKRGTAVRAREFARVLVSNPIYLTIWTERSQRVSEVPEVAEWISTVGTFVTEIQEPRSPHASSATNRCPTPSFIEFSKTRASRRAAATAKDGK